MRILSIVVTLFGFAQLASADCRELTHSTLDSLKKADAAVDFRNCSNEDLARLENQFSGNLKFYSTESVLWSPINHLDEVQHAILLTNRKATLALIRTEILSRKINRK